MESTTGDFTGLRRSSELNFLIGSQTTVKKPPRVPRRIINITPLDFNKIKKEVEEADTEEERRSLNSEQIQDECDANIIVPDTKPSQEAVIPETHRSDHKQLTTATPLRDLPLSRNTKENDSFDLNFSALSLVTPVKNCGPPQVPISEVINRTKTNPFNNFLTPKFNQKPSRVCYSASKENVVGSVKRVPFKAMTIEENEEYIVENENCGGNNNRNSFDTLSHSINTKSSEIFGFEKLRVKDTDYVVLNLLGKGGSSEVFACFCPEDKKHVAIKCVNLDNPTNAEGYINEVKLLQKLQSCDKIIKMYNYEIIEKDKKLLVVLERGGEDLSSILKNIAAQTSHIPFYMLYFYWMEMLYAVKQIHSHGIIHSDLKPANFLRADTGLKLIDFGIASSVQMDMTSVFKQVPEGSCNYISPEALNQESPTNSSPNSGPAKYKVHFKSDVWSLGCILYQFVYRKTPFHHIHNLWKKLAYIVNPNQVIEFPHVDWVPQRITDTMKKCLRYNVKERPSVDELIEEYESFLYVACPHNQNN